MALNRIILVASGKGGVGKSTVATNVALALAKAGYKTGLLDADVYGPSIPTMLGDAEVEASGEGKILPVEKYGIKAMSMGYLVDSNQAMIWRGPMLANAVTQLVEQVQWGELDYLVFDLPPGTGDIQLTLAQKLKVTGAVLVTTPQTVALADVMRAKAMFDKVRVETLGLIENMSYFICPSCNDRHEIFSHGGGKRAAEELGVPFFGGIPIEMAVRTGGDKGEPVVVSYPDSASAEAFTAIANALNERADVACAKTEKEERQRSALRIINN